MSAWNATARQATMLSCFSSNQSVSLAQSASLLHRRSFASGGDHHGPPKVNFWEDPLSPSKWKEEHFVIVSLAGWGLLLYGGYKFFSKGKTDKDKKKVREESR